MSLETRKSGTEDSSSQSTTDTYSQDRGLPDRNAERRMLDTNPIKDHLRLWEYTFSTLIGLREVPETEYMKNLKHRVNHFLVATESLVEENRYIEIYWQEGELYWELMLVGFPRIWEESEVKTALRDRDDGNLRILKQKLHPELDRLRDELRRSREAEAGGSKSR